MERGNLTFGVICCFIRKFINERACVLEYVWLTQVIDTVYQHKIGAGTIASNLTCEVLAIAEKMRKEIHLTYMLRNQNFT